jgi:hypothetical protein
MKTRRTADGNATQTAGNDVQASSRNVIPLRGANTEKMKQDTAILRIRPALQAVVLTHDLIAKRAWALWRERGCLPGQAEQNWHEAESLLRAELEAK